MSSNSTGDYAGFFRRMFAMIIDTGISYLLTWLLMTFTGVWSTMSTLTKMGMAMQTGGTGGAMLEPINVDSMMRGYQIVILFSIVYAIYMIIALSTPMRGTLGKFVLNVAIVDTHGQRIGLFQALVREVLKYIWILIAGFVFSFLAPYIFSGLMIPFMPGLMRGGVTAIVGIVLVGLFTVTMYGVLVGIGIFFNKRRRNIYDFLAGTMAVYANDWEDEKPARISMLRRLGGVAAMLVFAIAVSFPIYGLVVDERPAYLESVAAEIEEINRLIAAQAEDSESVSEPKLTQIQSRKRQIDWTGVEMVQKVVEEHAVSKQTLPESFSQLGLSNGELVDLGITRVDIAQNNVMPICQNSAMTDRLNRQASSAPQWSMAKAPNAMCTSAQIT